MDFQLRQHLRAGQVIPALPLALSRSRRWDVISQRALIRYYLDAGTGGLAVGVHSTQFAIRDPAVALYEPVLKLAAETVSSWTADKPRLFAMIAGICGRTRQALREATLARGLGYHAGLLSLGAWAGDPESKILRHCEQVAGEFPIIGFYLQPAVGGRAFTYEFWRRFAEIPQLVAIKIAPFDRYKTIDVVRAVIESGRDDVALYTGNDDNIIADLLTCFTFHRRTRYFDGGLLGQWGVWTERAVSLFRDIQESRAGTRLGAEWMTRNAALTDANAAIFDPAHEFAGCIPGIHEVLRRQGLMQSTALPGSRGAALPRSGQ
jgi:dihydrodipicolinate synthase/N-acetylneuraminate lyase